MALHRFFVEQQILSAETASTFPLALAPEDRRHAAVLRLRPHEHIAVIDGLGDYFECEVVSPDEPLTVRITGREDHGGDSIEVTLCVGMPKGSTFDGIVRGATELGVDRLIAFQGSRSIATPSDDRLLRRLERWRTIARNASMQAGRDRIPTIDAMASTVALAEALDDCDGVLVCWEEADAEATLPRALTSLDEASGQRPRKLALVIGPEGGLAEGEVTDLRNALPRSALLSLGPLILRVETAALCAVSQVFYELRR